MIIVNIKKMFVIDQSLINTFMAPKPDDARVDALYINIRFNIKQAKWGKIFHIVLI